MLVALVFATVQVAAAQPDTRGPAVAEPDVLIQITAQAEQVRWRQVGEIRVRTWSEPGGEGINENLSTGLPRPIPGQRTFRNVGWTLQAGARLTPEPADTNATPAESPSDQPNPSPQEDRP